jgi:tRNA-binding EMAP/Myf-like protein
MSSAQVEENQRVIVAVAPCRLPNGMDVEVQQIAGFESEGMLVSCRELKWPQNVFKPDQVIALPNCPLGPVPAYSECVSIKQNASKGKKQFLLYVYGRKQFLLCIMIWTKMNSFSIL